MDESVEKKIIEESADFSIFSLFLQADVVVKIVILLLLISSIWSWTIIFSKYTNLKSILMETEDFEEKFYSSETLSKLSKRIGGQPITQWKQFFLLRWSILIESKLGFQIKTSTLKVFVKMSKKKWKLLLIKN